MARLPPEIEITFIDSEDPDTLYRTRTVVQMAEDGSLTIGQDAKLYASLLGTGDRAEHTLGPGRIAWLQVAGGRSSNRSSRSRRPSKCHFVDTPMIDQIASDITSSDNCLQDVRRQNTVRIFGGLSQQLA